MTEFATFGAGCFWGPQAVFDNVPGVIETAAGYMGGKTKDPTENEIYSGMTGHIEVVHIKYNPRKITYTQLLKVFWGAHDPTQGSRQGVNIGTQYKSTIFYHTSKQKQEAEASLKIEQKKYAKKITTEIRKAETFYRAEEYHQKYALKHGRNVC